MKLLKKFIACVLMTSLMLEMFMLFMPTYVVQAADDIIFDPMLDLKQSRTEDRSGSALSFTFCTDPEKI
ncbi:hypothetical protein ACIOBL_27000 [Paenibacillus taichungensis]|uniref:hypothetical protein n=1 Tax=Paenibacillus taichungensis TaxID=484184 RepID=UPI003814B9D8